MRPVPDEPTTRLLDLRDRWQVEARALDTVLRELDEVRLDVQREAVFHRMLGEAQPDLDARCEELHAECESLAQELAHMRIALVGVETELRVRLRAPDPAPCRTSA